VVIDHVAGARRGQRQEFASSLRVRFGRHPDCEVSFDAHRDIDASSRHAELRPLAAGWVLVDVGSSNGTYVEGRRITEAPISANAPISVEFGPGGPRVRLFVGENDAIESLPPAPVERPELPRWIVPVGVGAVLVALLGLLLAKC
jgi:hypothetical protein